MKSYTKKRIFSWLGCLMSLCLCIALLGSSGVEAQAATLSSITSDSIKDKQQQIEQAEKEKKELQNSLSNLQDIKKNLESKKKDLKNYITELDSSLAKIEQNIADLQLKIAAKEKDIADTQAELEAAMERENNQKESMYARIKLVYEQGNASWTDILLTASSFGDFLNKADYVEKVIAYDHQMWEEYKDSRKYVELCKQQLELEKETLDQAKATVEQEQAAVEELIAQKSKDLIAYESDINNKEQAIKEYEAEIQAQKEEIEALEAAIAEEKKKILSANGVVLTYDGGQFKQPLAYFTRVSDDYGWRTHPILNTRQFHNGVDFASPKGTAIYAAYDGVVVAATYSSTMGNYVMIDHGDNLYTIYMHASKLYVSKDDIVVRGETIAAVGSTGRSTGNHLHFSVRVNGNYVSPWDYLKK